VWNDEKGIQALFGFGFALPLVPRKLDAMSTGDKEPLVFGFWLDRAWVVEEIAVLQPWA
jgi:hypothetical protein